jgi:site-specific recombinase
MNSPAFAGHRAIWLPFLGLNEEISDYVRERREQLTGHRLERSDDKQARVLIAQCRDTLQKVRKHAASTGVSISLTQLLVRISQMLNRIERLLTLLETTGEARHHAIVQLFKELVTADNHKHSVRDLFSAHTELLALLVTENAGHTGAHYVTTTRKGYFGMLRSGMGAGLIVGFMALLKMLAGKLSLAPFAAAFIYSMNYSLGFMLVHVLHFTIATKQPAMTASRIAASISDTQKDKEQDLEGLANLCVNIFRTQFIAILGNVALSIPTAYAIAWIWLLTTGHHLASPDKVDHLIHDLSPIESLALFHAAIAGVCLFLSGLISGYYDNKCLYKRIPERLQQRPLLQRLLGHERLARFSTYIGNNLGALAGNFYFGLMLGSMGTIGFILGLPLDIRHITFSSAYFSFALVGSEHQLPLQSIAISLIGIALIGLTNLLVSFALALMVALKSRRVRYRQWWPLTVLMCKRFLKKPRDFFWPPRDNEEAAKTSTPPH